MRCYLGSVIGSLAGFEVGLRYREKVLATFVSPRRREAMADLLERRGKWALLVTAVTPLPYIPVLFGTLPLSRTQFTLYAVIPRVLYFLYVTVFAFWVL